MFAHDCGQNVGKSVPTKRALGASTDRESRRVSGAAGRFEVQRGRRCQASLCSPYLTRDGLEVNMIPNVPSADCFPDFVLFQVVLPFLVGVVTTVVVGVAVALWRRFWNPLHWRLSMTQEGVWTVLRVARSTAMEMTIEAWYRYEQPSRSNNDYPPLYDVKRGKSLAVSRLVVPRWYRLGWIEGGARKYVHFQIRPGLNEIVFRRRDIGLLKNAPTLESLESMHAKG